MTSSSYGRAGQLRYNRPRGRRPTREEAAFQAHLAGRLEAAGAEVDVWEPDGDQLQGKPLVPPGLQFAGRPQLIARKPGRGTGRSLLLNRHIDVVSAEPRSS